MESKKTRDPRELRFEKYLRPDVNDLPPLGDLEFQTRKNEVWFDDLDLFHRIAQACKVLYLDKTCMGLRYHFQIPVEGQAPDHWSVFLVRGNSQNFLDKYGANYSVN
jgi:hypothetical protein